MIEVRLFATFRENREKISYLEPNNFKKAVDIIDYFELPHEEIAILLINGFHSKLDADIKDGDVLAIFPPVGGG